VQNDRRRLLVVSVSLCYMSSIIGFCCLQRRMYDCEQHLFTIKMVATLVQCMNEHKTNAKSRKEKL